MLLFRQATTAVMHHPPTHNPTVPMPASTPPCRFVQRANSGTSHHSCRGGLPPASTSTSHAKVTAQQADRQHQGADVELRRPDQHRHGQQQRRRKNMQTAAQQPRGRSTRRRPPTGWPSPAAARPSRPAGGRPPCRTSASHWSSTQGRPAKVKLKGSSRSTRPAAEHLLAGGDVPEAAGIAEHRAAPGDEQQQPDGKKRNDE